MRVQAMGQAGIASPEDRFALETRYFVLLEAEREEDVQQAADLVGVEVALQAVNPDEIGHNLTPEQLAERELIRARVDAGQVLASIVRFIHLGRLDVARDYAIGWLEKHAEVPEDIEQ